MFSSVFDQNLSPKERKRKNFQEIYQLAAQIPLKTDNIFGFRMKITCQRFSLLTLLQTRFNFKYHLKFHKGSEPKHPISMELLLGVHLMEIHTTLHTGQLWSPYFWIFIIETGYEPQKYHVILTKTINSFHADDWQSALLIRVWKAFKPFDADDWQRALLMCFILMVAEKFSL